MNIRNLYRTIISTMLLCLASGTSSANSTHYVSLSGGHQWPHTNWVTAATNIQAAIDAAQSGDSVTVTDGVYTLTAQVTLTNDITVSSVNGRDSVTVDGNQTVRCFSISNCQAVVAGLTIVRGRANERGGGVFIEGAGTVRDCIIRSNSIVNPSAYSGGAGVSLEYGGRVEGSTIEDNQGGNGGGVAIRGGGVLSNCTIARNRASDWTGGAGGGVLVGEGGVVQDCTIVSNSTVYGPGGGVFSWGSTVERCSVAGNSSGFGGGILCGATSEVRYCSITSNTAFDTWTGAGGGAFCAGSSSLKNSTVSGNRAVGPGGGVFFCGSTLENCRVADNLAAREGGGLCSAVEGVLSFDPSMFGDCRVANAANCLVVGNISSNCGGGALLSEGSLQNCTFVGNSASQAGGGMSCVSNVTVRNTIIWGNVAQSGANVATGSVGNVFSYCSSTPLFPGPGNITNAPQFVNAAAGDYHLAAGSPCIDAGIGSNAPNCDLDGVPRPLDGDSNGVAAVDMGAYEFSVWESNTHYVSPSGGHRWPYTNWITAATNIQAAVAAAIGGETVLVADGLYTLTSEVAVATNLIVRSANGAPVTLVDGALSTRCFRLMPEAGCILRGFTVTNGFAPDDWGGGLWMGSGNAIADCVFAACTARYGGAVYANLSTVSNCTFIGNTATLIGGGLHCDGGTVLNCAFEGNSAFLGGGMMETWTDPYPQIHDTSFVLESPVFGLMRPSVALRPCRGQGVGG